MSTSSKGFWPLIKLIPIRTNFRMMRFALPLAIISLVLSIGSIAVTVFPFTPPCGGLNCGVDFRGGTVIELSTAPREVDLGKIRSTLGGMGLGDIQVQQFGDPTDALVRFETPEGINPTQELELVKTELTKALGETKFTKQEVVGPKVSGELFGKGLLALVLGIGMMMLYIWFRFGLTFGLGAAAALMHDVVLTFGLFALTKMEFTLTTVAAILTIIGYSVNDTVVILDRVRENLRKYKKMPMNELLDLSINETFSRTIMTGVTGLMALTGLAVFGGEALFGFSIAMIFGIVVGTYSSFFVAAPILMWVGVRRNEDEDAKVEVLEPAPGR
ncbi:MAG: protein translocase subunit SecF [Caulobacter sp.]